MAATSTLSNEFKYEEGLGAIDFSGDTFKVALMATGFVFDKDSHGAWADVSASEIAAGNGYTSGGETLSASAAWAQDNTDDQGDIAWSNVTWTAVTGAIADFVAAIIYDDTHASKIIVGCVEFGETISVSVGNSFQLQSLAYESA